MHQKRIAVITARADAAEQKEILCGIAEAAFAADTDVVVYSNIYNHWTDDKLLNYENIIYTFFDSDYFDGAIITAEAFRDISILNETVEKIRKAKLHTVVIDGIIEGFESLFSDDESDMEKMAEHLIKIHGFTDIAILTGYENDATAQCRLNGCKKAFEKFNVSFDESKIYYGNFWNDSGEQLAQRYISGELTLPQAVICTNDHMAYGMCDALSAAGINIPEQLTITGYDNTGGDYAGGRIYHYPLLTTYRRNRRKMGYDAASRLLGIIQSDDSSERFIRGNTCPCGTERSQLINELNAERIGQYHTIMSSSAQFSSRLTMSRTLAEYTAAMSEFFYLLHGAERLYLCLDKEWSSESFDGEEYLCCTIENGKCSDVPDRFSKSEIPVPFIREGKNPSLFYVNPVCFQKRLFGYTVLKYNYPSSYDFSFRDWSKTAADTLESLRMKNDIHYLVQCQRASSMYDSLTGFYNLREFRQIIEAAENNGSLYAVKLGFVDEGEFLYGENYRNDIISALAYAMKQACVNHEICCRAYEDIFLILCRKNNEIFLERLKIMLYNAMCGSYDERQVILSCETLDNCTAEELCAAVEEKSRKDICMIMERKKLQHYNILMDIRSNLMKNPEKALPLSELSKQMCVSEGYFRSVYRKCFGISYNRDCIEARLFKARYCLAATAMSVYAVSMSCGCHDEKYFARLFRKNIGCSPMQYRKKYC